MKLYRFMSFKEFSKMTSGCEIKGRKHHNAKTSSSGVCFLGRWTSWESEVESVYTGYEPKQVSIIFSPEQCIRFLSGIVTNDVLVEFEVDDQNLHNVNESWGIYADSFGDYYDTIGVTEYCTPSYSRDNFIPMRYAVVDDSAVKVSTTWYDFN